MNGLSELLQRLKLEHLTNAVNNLLDQVEKEELNARETLIRVLAHEWNGWRRKGLESRLKSARLPWVKTLEQFDFSLQPGIDHKVIRELAGVVFVGRNENVILLGKRGCG